MIICLERCADLHMAQLMPLPLTVSCFSKIQIGFTFLALADLGSPGQRAVKWVCVCILLLIAEVKHNVELDIYILTGVAGVARPGSGVDPGGARRAIAPSKNIPGREYLVAPSKF